MPHLAARIALELWTDAEHSIPAQTLNRERVRSGGHGSGVALEELRRTAGEVILRMKYFRALTSPSVKTDEQKDALIVEFDKKWANRRRAGRKKKAEDGK
jgi:hypothetical protein